jgi:hypothetical protein
MLSLLLAGCHSKPQLPFPKRPQEMDAHVQFDLAFRTYETGMKGNFQHRPFLVGTCGGVAGPNGSATRFLLTPPRDLADYMHTAGLRGVVGIVTPAHPGSSVVSKRRVPGSPKYKLICEDSSHWYWEELPGTQAGISELVSGSEHQVAYRTEVAPSDPTIEQFKPHTSTYFLYLVQP